MARDEVPPERLRGEIDSAGEIAYQVEGLLLAGRFEELEALASGEGMSASEIEEAFFRCGLQIQTSPEITGQSAMTAHIDPNSPSALVRFSLHRSEEETPSVWVTCIVSGPVTGKRTVAIQSIEPDSPG